jgi:hypothetical protein
MVAARQLTERRRNAKSAHPLRLLPPMAPVVREVERPVETERQDIDIGG